MSALRKAGVWLGLVEEEDEREYDRGYRDSGYSDRGRDRDSGYRYADEFADEDDDVDDGPALPRARASERSRLSDRRAHGDLDRDDADRSSVRSITRPASASGDGGYHTRERDVVPPQSPMPQRTADDDQRYQITTLHPTTYREARTIGEHFRDGVPVIINLTEMDEGDARRLVDFAAGLAFGLRGTIERVTNRVFLLSPANVQVTAEDKAKIAEGGFFTQS
jgi:cell division inhibitor SepF